MSRPRLWPALLPGALSALSGVGLLATSGWLITRASERPPVLSLCVAIGAVQAFSLGRGIFRYLQRLGVHSLSLERLGRLRLQLFDLLEPRVPGTATGSEPASALSGFLADADALAQGLAKGLSTATDVAGSIVFASVLAALVEPLLGLAVLGAGAGPVAVAWAVSRLAARSEREAAAGRAALANLVTETVRCARELVVYGREDLVGQQLHEVHRREASVAVRRAWVSGLARAGTALAAGAGTVGVVTAALVARSSGRLSGPALAATVFGALAALDQCSSLPAALASREAARAAHGRIASLASLPAVPSPTWGPSTPAAAGEGALEGAEVVLGGGVRALNGLSLRVPAGGRVALTGPSGAGKTTAVHALLHFVECSAGRATLGGLDVRGLTRASIARLAGWLPDETYLFAASLGDNLRTGCPTASDAECVEALRRVGLAGWFASLPDGLATPLGAGGRPLSGGEAQRIGLARVLLSGAALLLLDEPTSRLDPATSARVLPELLGAAQGRSVLVVSHDPGVARLVDQVVALPRGAGAAAQLGRQGPAGCRWGSAPQSPLGDPPGHGGLPATAATAQP